MNEHLLPELIINLVTQFKTARRENEFLNLQMRLETIRNYVNAALQEKEIEELKKNAFLDELQKGAFRRRK